MPINNTSSPSPGSSGNLSNVCEDISADALDGSRSITQEGDNREVTIPAKQTNEETPQNSFLSQPSDPWHETFTELRAMRARIENMDTKMGKLDTIEESTSSLSSQLLSVVQKTTEIEAKVELNTTKTNANETKICDLKEEINSLRELVEKQGQTIAGLSRIDEEVTKNNKRTLGEMNGLISQQKQQVDQFKDTAKRLKADIKIDIESEVIHKLEDKMEDTSKRIVEEVQSDVSQKINDKMEELSQDLSYKDLKERAFNNRYNLVITGLKENADKSTKSSVYDFLKTNFKVKDVDIYSAYRIGTSSHDDATYARPILVQFSHLPHRNKVWKMRMNITNNKGNEGDVPIRIQADLPKKLRDDVQVLYRVAKAAAQIPEYQSAVVRDYALHLNGREYLPRELESLPFPIRPSTLATRTSDEAIVFFSRHSILSNHHPSKFQLQNVTFNNVEHYLAYKRALLSGQQSIIQKALILKYPTEAKGILNSLKKNHTKEWEDNRAIWATEAIRAKFFQNPDLANILCATEGKQLGEASRNQVWAIGKDLDDPEVLDITKWSPSGNLLGKTIMTIREEILADKRPLPE